MPVEREADFVKSHFGFDCCCAVRFLLLFRAVVWSRPGSSFIFLLPDTRFLVIPVFDCSSVFECRRLGVCDSPCTPSSSLLSSGAIGFQLVPVSCALSGLHVLSFSLGLSVNNSISSVQSSSCSVTSASQSRGYLLPSVSRLLSPFVCLGLLVSPLLFY